MKLVLLASVLLMIVIEFLLVTNPALYIGDNVMMLLMVMLPCAAIGLLMEVRKA